ncbi:MAG: conjugal transfer protein TraX [Clostridiales Family XIII bacterium]|nr:conjugal transfer protein TraX [Clostridiales Family XIII bacterium]
MSNLKGLSTNALKIIAIICMALDHAPFIAVDSKAVYYDFPWFLLHAVGRITAPIFFYLLAVGYRRTRNANRYTLRLLVFALISYVPYVWYFEDAPPDASNFTHLNVIFTMLFGLLMLRSIHEIPSKPLKAVGVALCLLGAFYADYGLYGMAIILVFDLCRGDRGRTILGFGAVCMVYVYKNVMTIVGDGPDALTAMFSAWQTPLYAHYFIVQLCQLIPLTLIAAHRLWQPDANEERPGFIAKWGFYIFYPAHIIILLTIRNYYF